MNTITLSSLSENIEHLLNTVHNNIFIVPFEQTEISYGDLDDYDSEYIIEHNIPAYNIGRSAGTIVHAAGSIAAVVFLDIKYDFIHEQFCNSAIDYLSQTIGGEHSFTHDGNDVMIDGYKTLSITETKYEGSFNKIYSAIQIPVSLDMETIQHVCTKPMVKIPKALSDFGINTENMLQFLNEWWTDYCEEHGIFM